MSKQRIKKVGGPLKNQNQKNQQWDTDLKLPEGLTFAEIGDIKSKQLAEQQKVRSKKVEARERKAKQD